MTINYYISNPMVQPVFHLSVSPLIETAALQHPNTETRDARGDHLENLAKFRVDGNHCPPLIHTSSHFVMQGSQVGQMQFALDKSFLAVPIHLLLQWPEMIFKIIDLVTLLAPL